MKLLMLAAVFLILPAAAAAQARTAQQAGRAEQRPAQGFCDDLFRDSRKKFDDGHSIYLGSSAQPPFVDFCLADGTISKRADLPAVAFGQTTMVLKEGFAGIAYRGKGKRGVRLAIFRSTGELIADLKMSELNTTLWVENGKLHAGGPKDGVTVLDLSGKVLERKPLPATSQPKK